MPAPAGSTSPDVSSGAQTGSLHAISSPLGEEPAPRLVERKTELRGQAIAPGRVPAHAVRKDTESDLNAKNPEIPYVKTERAIRDLVCSLMERQDRMNEEILLRVIDLQYRMDDLEASRAGRAKGSGR